MAASTPSRDHALVIGGSIAGLLAARVLADQFRQVTVLDRDELPLEPSPRAGVPQGAHIHLLLRRGLLAIEQLLPGFAADLRGAGAVPIDWCADTDWYSPDGHSPRFPSGITGLACSRALLEHTVRRRVLAGAHIHAVQRCEATGLVLDGTSARVNGLTVRYRRDAAGGAPSLDCDLAVDASGRTSRLPEWLSAAGYLPPPETVVNAALGYATRLYRPAGTPVDWQALLVRDSPPRAAQGGVIMAIEGGRWIVTLAGGGADIPPVSVDGFEDFARRLVHPALHDALQAAEPISPVVGFQRTENRLRHYEKLARWPGGLLVIGDAACSFNPVYGQGITVAALEALALQTWLRDGAPRSFQATVARLVRTPWLMAAGEDARVPGAQISSSQKGGSGLPGRSARMVQRYVDEVQRVSARDPAVRLAFTEVVHLLRSPGALFRPSILARVLPSLWAARSSQAGRRVAVQS